MCGVWLTIALRESREALLAAAHRGPDAEGLKTFETPAGLVVMGHRRLSIYDLSAAGSQPMTVRGCTVIFNGAIYNFRELRTELENAGHVFSTQTDTEVLLAAYLAWGEGCVARFNGMFAFALYDAPRQRLFLARDRFGEKPLHFAKTGGGLAFASEIAQLLTFAPDLARLNEGRTGDFLNLGMVDASDETFFKEVLRFPAAHHAIIDLSRAGRTELAPVRYWSAPPVDKRFTRPEDAASELASLMQGAVRLRLAADVPVGTCLSGGLDSTWIARLAGEQRGTGPAFSCISAVFDAEDVAGASLSERPFVEAAAEGARFDVQIVSPSDREVAEQFDPIVRAQGEPFASASICAQYFVFRQAHRAGLKVMLDGQGADELFGGYAGMIGAYLADAVASFDLGRWRRELSAMGAPGGDMSEGDLFRATYANMLPEEARRLIGRLRGRWPPPGLLAPRLNLPPAEPGAKGSRFDRLVRQLVAHASLPGLLRYEDRNAMAHGVETRLPFLDTEVAGLALRLPASAKIAAGETKRVVRLAAAGVVPEVILRRRRKLGFVAPQDLWLRGALGGLARDAIATARREWSGLFDLPALELAERGMGHDQTAGLLAFRVLSFIRWAKLHRVSA